MALNTFFPETWLKVLNFKLQPLSIPREICVTDYTGAIKAGNVLHEAFASDVAIRDYTRTAITSDALSLTSKPLVIDRAKYASIFVDDLDKAAAAGDLMGPATTNMSIKFTQEENRDMLTTAVAGATENDPVGTGAAPYSFSTTGHSLVYFLALLAERLANAENDIPGRFLLLTPELVTQGIISKELVRSTTMGDQILVNGRLGNTLAGFNLYEISNQIMPVDTVGSHLCIAGNNGAMGYAGQIDEIEGYRSQTLFSDVVRSLRSYGFNVRRPESLVLGHWAP